MRRLPNGQIMLQVLIGIGLMLILLGGIVNWSSTNLHFAQQTSNKEQAFHIAEAGIEYYRWHLAHASQDYQDGTGQPGPYVHEFQDRNNVVIGSFTLEITPPPVGSTIVTISSTGKVAVKPDLQRTITARLAIPSLAKYAVVANADMRFGQGTEVFGPIHSNGGIRFDGLTHNIISSAQTSYNDLDHPGGNEFGVHTHVNPPPGSGVNDTFRPLEAPPTSPVPTRSDVFEAGRDFPVPAVDFAGLTADLAQMKADAQANGFYRPSAGAQGYHIVLKTNDTFDLFRVTTFTNPPASCNNAAGQAGWKTWSIQNQNLIGNFPFPGNGLIVLEDDVFVDGSINTARLTIVAAFFPDNPTFRKNIIVNNDIRYTNYDGQDVLALIAQGNVNVGMVSEDDLRIDAALIAQNGRVGRHYYDPPPPNPSCAPYHRRQQLTLYGMIATNQRYGFAYTDGNGYQIRDLVYDANLLYSPPPSFPLTSDQYTILSWDEVP